MKKCVMLWGSLILTVAVLGPAMAAESAMNLSARLEQMTQGLAGRTGVAAQLIGSQNVVTVNGDAAFAMASTVKVAVAATVLDRVDKGELTLDQFVDITPDMIAAGDNVIAKNFVHPGIKFSVANLIEAMITESDNTATDACFELAGGPAAVTAKLRSIGIVNQRADRATAALMQDFYRLPAPGTPRVVAEAMQKDPTFAARIGERNLDFEKDPRDSTTPTAMLDLLLAIDSGKALSPRSREFLLGSMSRTRTGMARLGGLLPRGTPVAHKTGTLGGVANDVGYVTLPDGRRFAIAVFTSSSTTPEADRDRAIAEVTRTLYDYYLLQSPPQP